MNWNVFTIFKKLINKWTIFARKNINICMKKIVSMYDAAEICDNIFKIFVLTSDDVYNNLSMFFIFYILL